MTDRDGLGREDVVRHQEECQFSLKRKSAVSTISFSRSKGGGAARRTVAGGVRKHVLSREGRPQGKEAREEDEKI